MKHKIEKIIKDDLTHLKCTKCGTEDTFKTFDDTDKFKCRTISIDHELDIRNILTCLTCNRATSLYRWDVIDCFYE